MHRAAATGGRLQPVLMRHPPQLSVKTCGGGLVGSWGGGGVGWRMWGGGSAGGCGGGFARGGGGGGDPLLPHAYLQGGCVSGAGLGKLLVAVVKQRLQMGRCATVVVVIFHFATNDIC